MDSLTPDSPSSTLNRSFAKRADHLFIFLSSHTLQIQRRQRLTTGVYVKMPSEKLEKKVIPFHITVNWNKEMESLFPSWNGESASWLKSKY